MGPSKLAATGGGDFVPLAVKKTTGGVVHCRMLTNKKSETTLISGNLQGLATIIKTIPGDLEDHQQIIPQVQQSAENLRRSTE